MKADDTAQNTDSSIFLNGHVENRIVDRFEITLQALGEKWADVYNDLGWDKGFASKVRRGLLIPPLWQRVQLAKRMKVDTSVLWKIQDLITTDLEVNK